MIISGQFNRRIKIQRFVDIAHFFVGVGGAILLTVHPLNVNEGSVFLT